jgi:signal transduction histidine kinase
MLDVQRMMQVLINLISNAIKFSRKRGEVYIQVIKHGALDVGFANIEIQVADQGIGMTEEHLQGIFKPFH